MVILLIQESYFKIDSMILELLLEPLDYFQAPNWSQNQILWGI